MDKSNKTIDFWAIRNYPDKIEYTPSGNDRPTYQVEIFGKLKLFGSTTDVVLVCFREIILWLQEDIGEVKFLPIEEFVKKYEKFVLTEEKS